MRLANLVKPLPVLLPRIQLDGPGKGADDCRAALNGKFMDWWQERVAKAILVKADGEPASLAVELVELELTAIASLNGTARMNAEKRMVQMAAALKNISCMHQSKGKDRACFRRRRETATAAF